MHKFTIFTLIFSGLVIAVVAELIFNNYLDEKKYATSTISEEDIVGTVTQTDVSPTPTDDSSNPTDSEETAQPVSFKISAEILQASGFIKPVYEEVDFSGKLFELVEVAGVDSNQVFKGTVFEDKDFAAAVYEIAFSDQAGSDELYTFIKDSAVKLANTSINETNSFVKSFYINNSEKKKTVFLVVQIGTVIYGFEYPHKSHSKVKELIGKLGRNND